MHDNNAIDPIIMHKIDHNANHFVTNNIFPDFLTLYSLETMILLNKKSIKEIVHDKIQISGANFLIESIRPFQFETYNGTRTPSENGQRRECWGHTHTI